MRDPVRLMGEAVGEGIPITRRAFVSEVPGPHPHRTKRLHRAAITTVFSSSAEPGLRSTDRPTELHLAIRAAKASGSTKSSAWTVASWPEQPRCLRPTLRTQLF